MCFPHDEKIVTIDQLSFIKLDYRVTPSHQTSLNAPHVLVVPSPSSYLLPIIGKMGGMAPTSGYHTGVKPLDFMQKGETYQYLDIMFGRSKFTRIVIFLFQAR